MNRIMTIGLIWIALLLTACKGDGQETVEEPEKTPTLLSVYVYSPDHPIPTRAVNGEVDAVNTETDITSFQIWVFETGTNNLVAYHSPQEAGNSLDFSTGEGRVYQLIVSDAFAAASPKPNVDVYVVANIAETNSGFVLGKNTLRSELEAKVLENKNSPPETTGQPDYFGLTAPITIIPDAGLPMAGVLRNQEIGGSNPVYRVGKDALVTVKLERIVSKVRFIFCREGEEGQTEEEDEKVRIDGITFESDDILAIPDKEYLFLGSTGDNHVETTGAYRNGTLFSSASLENSVLIKVNADPSAFIYTSEFVYDEESGPQAYEKKIADALKEEEGKVATLTQIGPYYLRESDKKIEGKIYYHVGDEDLNTRSAVFQLSDAGDFSRNHSWIVYAYYLGKKLHILTVTHIGMKDWIIVADNEENKKRVYNW